MYKEINSEVYKDIRFKLELRYFVDDNNVWWYCYDDISNFIELSNQIASQVYTYKIKDSDKQTCVDYNNYNQYNEQHAIPRNFITSEAVRYLVQRNNERNDRLMKSINNLETIYDSNSVYKEDVELNDRINVLSEAVKHRDYEEIFYQSHMISKSQTSRDTLHKLGKVNKYNEELLDIIREDLYYEEEDFEEVYVIIKREHDEEKQAYKKNRGKQKRSSAPSWLRKVVK